MFLTNVLLKKAKSKNIMVMMESIVSGHKFNTIRERLADKLELIRFDPFSLLKTKAMWVPDPRRTNNKLSQFNMKVFTRRKRKYEVSSKTR